MSATYAPLPPGPYRFEVRCENEEGFSSRITPFAFVIRPVFYQTWWFLALVAIITGAVAYYFIRQRVLRLLAIERVRSRVARDLHDDMGSTLSTINILSSMAKTRLSQDPVKTSEYITKIGENSQRMMEAMDDIVWSIKPMNDSIQKIIARMREFAIGVLEAKDILVRIKVDEQVLNLTLDMETRRDFFLVFKEAINNAAKYAKCQVVDVHITAHRGRLLLSVKDNGIGFDTSTADGNGLGNMQKRAENMKGRVQIRTKPGAGTEVLLNIPTR